MWWQLGPLDACGVSSAVDSISPAMLNMAVGFEKPWFRGVISCRVFCSHVKPCELGILQYMFQKGKTTEQFTFEFTSYGSYNFARTMFLFP